MALAPRLVGKTIAEGPLFHLIAGPEREGAGEAAGIDGVRRLYAFSRLEREPQTIYVAVGIPSSYAFDDARRALTSSMFTLAIAAFLTLLAARLVSERSVLRRTRALTAAAARMAAGDLATRVGDGGAAGDELTRLAATFDDMAANLQRAHEGEQQRYLQLLERDRALQSASHTLELQKQRLDVLSQELLRAQEQGMRKVDVFVTSDRDFTDPGAVADRLSAQVRIMLPAVFLRQIAGWTSEELEAIRDRTWADLT